MIAAGRLDRRVTLQTPTTSVGTLGGHSESWATLATVWANVRDLSGRETFNAQAAGSAVGKVVTIRWLSGVEAKQRVLLPDGAVARIAWIEEIGRREGLKLYCEAING